jgi:hypothetical protein
MHGKRGAEREKRGEQRAVAEKNKEICNKNKMLHKVLYEFLRRRLAGLRAPNCGSLAQ